MCLKLPGAQFKRTKCALNYLALLLVSKSCFLASGLVGSEPKTNYFANDANEVEKCVMMRNLGGKSKREIKLESNWNSLEARESTY